MNDVHYKIRVSGKVQGVWFRASTKEKALELGLKGLVKNLSNGDVYIEAEGESKDAIALIAWCKIGSEKSKVDEVRTKEGEVKNYESFKIQY